MKQPSSACGRGPAKARRKTREELNQEARDRKREKKHSGHAPGSRAAGSTERNNKVGRGVPYNDPRIGSKKPVPLGVSDVPARQSVQEPPEERRLSPEAELEMLESDDCLDALLERLENGETLSAEEQQWVDEKLDRINVLMQRLGLSFDDEENDEEREDDLMRLLKGGK